MHYPSRARARDAIKRGCVSIDGEVSTKVSRNVGGGELVETDDPAQKYVSRAALKLLHGLKITQFSPAGKIAVDVGASTGGFCQVLLEHDAKKVFAVDVGHDQMINSVSGDSRLVNLEGLNARELKLEHLDNLQPQYLTCDVSFISLKLALPPVLTIAEDGAEGIFLVKPQFEVGRDHVGRGGIVKDENMGERFARETHDWLSDFEGWKATHFARSPIIGGDGNTEYLIAGIKNG